MPTNLHIDPELLEEAQRLGRHRTKRETVNEALREYIQYRKRLEAVKAFGTIESVKTLSDLYAPLNGKIVDVNKELDGKPELVNEDPYGAWMVVIEAADAGAIAQLLDAQAYAEHVKASG